MAKCIGKLADGTPCNVEWQWDWEQDNLRAEGLDGMFCKIEETFVKEIPISVLICPVCGVVITILVDDPKKGFGPFSPQEWGKINWEEDEHSYGQTSGKIEDRIIKTGETTKVSGHQIEKFDFVHSVLQIFFKDDKAPGATIIVPQQRVTALKSRLLRAKEIEVNSWGGIESITWSKGDKAKTKDWQKVIYDKGTGQFSSVTADMTTIQDGLAKIQLRAFEEDDWDAFAGCDSSCPKIGDISVITDSKIIGGALIVDGQMIHIYVLHDSKWLTESIELSFFKQFNSESEAIEWVSTIRTPINKDLLIKGHNFTQI